MTDPNLSRKIECTEGTVEVGAHPLPCTADESVPGALAAAGAQALFTSLYADLRRLARREVRRNAADMSRRPALAFEGAGRFLAYAARAMRGLVIDRVRARHSHKRGGDFVITSFDTHNADQVAQPEFLQSVGEALDELSAF